MKKLIGLTFLLFSVGAYSQVVNVGTGANTGDGDKLRDAMVKINTAFQKDADSISSYHTRLTTIEEDSTGAFNYAEFNTTYEDGVAEGRLQWNIDDGTLEVGMPGDSVNLQIGQEMLIRATNNEGTDISNGQLVYISGGAGANPYVKLADNRYITKVPVIGMATEDIANGQKGYVTTEGLVRNVDTDGMSIGDVLWLDTTGSFTNTMPTSPALANQVGFVIRAQQNNGVVYIKPKFYPLVSMLSDVYVSSIANNNELVWDTTDSRWENTARNVFTDYVKTDSIPEYTSGHGVSIDQSLVKDGTVYPNISYDDEYIIATGVGLAVNGADQGLLLRRPINTVASGNNFVFQLHNSNSDYVNYSYINTQIVDNTAGTESGALRFFTRDAGSLVQKMYISSAYVTVEVPLLATSVFKTDSIMEYLSGRGVYIDGLLLKDSRIYPTYSDAGTYIYKDGSNNLSFTDAITGTKTLAQLSSLSGVTGGDGITITGDTLVEWGGTIADNVEVTTNDESLYMNLRVGDGSTEQTGNYFLYNTYNELSVQDPTSSIVAYTGAYGGLTGMSAVNGVAVGGLQNRSAIEIDTTGMVVDDDLHSRGLVYNSSSYRDNFVDTSLVDKGYVDDAIASGTTYTAGEDIRISNDSIIFDYDGGYAVFSENMWFEADTSERMFYVVVPGESINPSSAFTIEDDDVTIETYQPLVAANSGVARIAAEYGVIQSPDIVGVVTKMGIYSNAYNMQLRIDSTEIMIEDDVNERGVVYATNDYDDNFVDSSLITKKYVDTALYRTKHPHTWLYFADSSITITADQNTYYQITNASDSLWRVRDLYGEITISADTVIVTSHDHYNVWASISFTGTVNDDYQIRLVQAEAGGAVGEIAKTYVSTDGTNPVTVSLYGYWKPVDGDRLWIQIRNTASGDDPTIIGGEMTVQWYHYE